MQRSLLSLDALGRPMRSSWTSIRQLSTFLSQGSETVPPHYARYPLDDTFGCFRADMAVCGRARTKLYLSFFKPENVWGSRGSHPLILDLRALDGSERSASRSGHFTSREKVKGTHWTRGWALHFKKDENFLTLQGIEPRFLSYLVSAILQKNINYVVTDVRV